MYCGLIVCYILSLNFINAHSSFLLRIETGKENCTGAVISKRWIVTANCIRNRTLEQIFLDLPDGKRLNPVRIEERDIPELVDFSIFLLEADLPSEVSASRVPLGTYVSSIYECSFYRIGQDGKVFSSSAEAIRAASCNSQYDVISTMEHECCATYMLRSGEDPPEGSSLLCRNSLTGLLHSQSYKKTQEGETVGVFLSIPSFIPFIKLHVADIQIADPQKKLLKGSPAKGSNTASAREICYLVTFFGCLINFYNFYGYSTNIFNYY